MPLPDLLRRALEEEALRLAERDQHRDSDRHESDDVLLQHLRNLCPSD